jgi:hypothetical protein
MLIGSHGEPAGGSNQAGAESFQVVISAHDPAKNTKASMNASPKCVGNKPDADFGHRPLDKFFIGNEQKGAKRERKPRLKEDAEDAENYGVA